MKDIGIRKSELAIQIQEFYGKSWKFEEKTKIVT